MLYIFLVYMPQGETEVVLTSLDACEAARAVVQLQGHRTTLCYMERESIHNQKETQ
jgi:hypothetical protein